jgi:hypothetical protein
MAKDFDLGDTVACLRYNAGESRRLLIDCSNINASCNVTP